MTTGQSDLAPIASAAIQESRAGIFTMMTRSRRRTASGGRPGSIATGMAPEVVRNWTCETSIQGAASTVTWTWTLPLASRWTGVEPAGTSPAGVTAVRVIIGPVV